MVPGTLATDVLELDSVTTVPDGPASPFNVTIPVTEAVEVAETLLGEMTTLTIVAGNTVTVQVARESPRDPKRTTEVFASTP